MSIELPCYVLIADDKSDAKVEELRKMLEKGDTPKKIAALKQVICS